MRFERTPAQVSGRYDFVTDVPIQGPTDEGMRAASCWWTQNVLPVKKPACVDCTGPIPKWANNPTSWGGGWPQYGGNGGPSCRGEFVQHNGRRVAGFALDGAPRGWSVEDYRDAGSLAAAGDPAATLTSDQQAWVVSTLNTLNTNIGQRTGTSCPGWQDAGTSLAAAVGCFQLWANANGKGSLRSDGVLDQDTLKALITVAQAHASDFPTMYPTAPPASAPPEPPPQPATPAAAPAAPVPAAPPEPPPVDVSGAVVKAHMTKNAKIAIAAASAIAVGGIIYTATRRKR